MWGNSQLSSKKGHPRWREQAGGWLGWEVRSNREREVGTDGGLGFYLSETFL